MFKNIILKLISTLPIFLLFFNSLASAQHIPDCANILTEKDFPKVLAQQILGLNYDFVFRESLNNLETLLFDYDRLSLPKFKNPPQKLTTLSLSKIHFMQKSTKYKSSSRKGGYEVLDTAQDLMSGHLNITSLPPIQVWMDETGKLWTLDHRRLVAIIMSGRFDKIPVLWATKEEVAGDYNKFDPLNEGRSTDLVNYRSDKRGGQWAVRVSIPR